MNPTRGSSSPAWPLPDSAVTDSGAEDGPVIRLMKLVTVDRIIQEVRESENRLRSYPIPYAVTFVDASFPERCHSSEPLERYVAPHLCFRHRQTGRSGHCRWLGAGLGLWNSTSRGTPRR